MHDKLVPGLDEAAGHGKAHLAQSDKSDVHAISSCAFTLIASEAKQSRAARLDCFVARAPRNDGSVLLHLGEHFARDAKTVDACGNAGIAGDLHEDLADFVLA